MPEDPITRNWICLPPEMMEEPVVQEYFEEVDRLRRTPW